MITDAAVTVCARYGGDRCGRWAKRAQKYEIINYTTARYTYLCLLRAMGAAIDDHPVISQSIKDTTRWVVEAQTGDIYRETPLAIVSRVIARNNEAVDRLCRSRGWGTVYDAGYRRMSEDARQLAKYRNWLRRQPAKVRRSIRHRERIIASIRAEAAIDWWRHPFAHKLQEQDDREARLLGDRVY
jgi:hypothetical protein